MMNGKSFLGVNFTGAGTTPLRAAVGSAAPWQGTDFMSSASSSRLIDESSLSCCSGQRQLSPWIFVNELTAARLTNII
jgi:hypothetical protein